MLTIRAMKKEDYAVVFPMVKGFYSSDAVDHNVPVDILEQTFKDAVSESPFLEGHVLEDDNQVVGFAYVTLFYACEVGGQCMMLEELYINEEHRGCGYGSKYFDYLLKNYPKIKRIRLEVTDANDKAIALYKRLGFEFLNYKQMVKEL